MMKQAWRSYLASLNLRNIKKINAEKTPSWFLVFYWLFFFPANIVSNSTETGLHYGVYIAYLIVKLLPLLLLMWSNVVDKLSIPKALYLSPMRVEEREEYVRGLMMIKILTPAVFSILLQIVWGCFFEFNILQMILVAFLYISIGIASYIASDLINKYNRNISPAVRDKNGEPKDAWLNVVTCIISILFLIGLEVRDLVNNATFSEASIFENVVLYGTLSIILIMDIVIMKTRYTAAIIDRCDYEIAFKILPKKKKK